MRLFRSAVSVYPDRALRSCHPGIDLAHDLLDALGRWRPRLARCPACLDLVENAANALRDQKVIHEVSPNGCKVGVGCTWIRDELVVMGITGNERRRPTTGS